MHSYPENMPPASKGLRLHALLAAILSLLTILPLRADCYNDYIDSYCTLAQAEMEKYGIPASITLAQGLLESAAGRSALAREGNNHFGIKCHRDWNGKSMLRDDDAPDECFRVYSDPAESFRDHSIFLTRKRYEKLFELDPTDYSGWAKGLRECGYATDPHYADRIIAIVERYSLHTYDTPGQHRGESGADYIMAQLGATHRICRYRGLHYVVGAPGDTYASIAAQFNTDAARLASINDASDAGSEIRPWEEVYFEPKLETAPDGIKHATIGADETLRSVAQRYGMTEAAVRKLNPNAADRPGTRLKLR